MDSCQDSHFSIMQILIRKTYLLMLLAGSYEKIH